MIKCLRLLNGMIMMGEQTSESATHYHLENVVTLSFFQDPDNQNKPTNVGVSSATPLGDTSEKDLTLAKTSVLYSYTPGADLYNLYSKIFGSGLVVPSPDITGKTFLKG